MRTPEENAAAICEVLQREADLLKRYGRYRLILAVLQGAEMREAKCGRCKGAGKYDVECERSGGTLYDETRGCYDCNKTGRVRRLVFDHRAVPSKG